MNEVLQGFDRTYEGLKRAEVQKIGEAVWGF